MLSENLRISGDISSTRVSKNRNSNREEYDGGEELDDEDYGDEDGEERKNTSSTGDKLSDDKQLEKYNEGGIERTL